jgi:hypothetical protein
VHRPHYASHLHVVGRVERHLAGQRLSATLKQTLALRVSVAVPSASETRFAVRSSLVAKLTRTWQLSRMELFWPYAFSI